MVTEVGGEVKRRKSARLLALEEEKKNKACTVESETAISENQTHVRSGTFTGRRGRKRKKLEDVGLSSPQDSEDARDEDYSIYDDEAAYLSYLQEDPETPVLELILDILQRRDTCNLFAKPVDPQEVWTYYRIIKEPMDFGTIRTKLQEGNYTSLEKFEHDVNLISTNAMHFNALTTVFYQEAQAIQELAQQLFRSLRADPEQFKLQFLPTKRPPGRKAQNHGRGSQRRVGRPSSSRGPYVRRKSRAGSSTANSSGMINSRNSNSLGMERRETYRLSEENKSLLSVVCDSAKILHVDNGDSGYKESLMKFAQNLGPTAQRLAESKLAQLNQSPNFQPQATHSIQTQNYMDPALPVLPFPAPKVPGHFLDGYNGQIHRGSPYYVHSSDSNASNFHDDASAQGYAGISNCGMCISDTANVTNLNPPSTPQLGMIPNYCDKGKMVDFSQNMELGGTGDTEARDYSLNQNSNFRLESHIRVLRDFTSPGTSSSGMKFRAVDMLGKPNPLENQQQFQHVHQLPSCTGTSSSSILSWAVNRLTNTSRQENQQLQPAQLSSTGSPNQSNLVKIMAGRSTYLKPSSSSLRFPSVLLSSLSEAPTSWNDFDSQLNNNNAQTGRLLQWSQCGAEQNMQENGSYQEMLGVINGQCKKSTPPIIEHLGEGNYSWGSNTFVKNDQQFGEVNCQLGNSTSMRKEKLLGQGNARWGSNAFLRKEHLANRNFQQKNNAFLNSAFLPETDDLGNSMYLWKKRQLEEENVQLGNSTLIRKKQLDEANFQVWSSTSLRTEQQFDHGTYLQGDTSFMSKVPQVDRNNLQMGNSTFMSNVQVLNEGSFRQGDGTFMSNAQVLNVGSFREDNSIFMRKGQLPEGSFQLGNSSCMMTQQQIDKVNDQWWNSTLISKNQQLCDSNNQLGSTYLRNDQKLDYEYLGREQEQLVDGGVMPDWYNAICSTNLRATKSSSTTWYQKEPLDQTLPSLLMVDNQTPNLALHL